MEDHLLKKSYQYKNHILETLSKESITDILNSKEYYLSKAIYSYHAFLNMKVQDKVQSIFSKPNHQKVKLPFYEGAIEKVNRFYATKSTQNYGDFLKSIGTSPDSEMLRKAAEVVAYSDFNAWNKNELNQYPDKRVIAKSHVRQNHWIISFILFKKNRDYSEISSSNIINALKFFESPYDRSNIVSENHRASIVKNFLELDYEPSLFEETLDTFFKFYDGLNFQNSDNRQLLYTKILYSKTFRHLWDKNNNIESNSFKVEDDINNSSNFYHDSEIIPDGIAKEDVLNRKGLMQVIHKKVKSYWNDKNQADSFTLLINGPWGSGKSSMLYYLKEFLTKEDNWNVVEYNAWKNQRFDIPWWILVNKISHDISSISDRKFHLIDNSPHWFWKNISQHSIKYIVATVVAIIFIIAFLNNWFGQQETFSFLGKLLALVGSVWLAIQGVIKQLFKKQALNELQTENVSDPLEVYKDRFEKVVKHKKVAIFIDDLDRCEVEPTIKLLEGIQTLFKGSKVLYIMAADGQWVVNCFDKKYKDFESLSPQGQTIGHQFLQKTFQLIVDVPKINKQQVTILLRKNLKQEDFKQEKERISEYSSADIEGAKTVEQLRDISRTGDDQAKQKATERIEEVAQENSKELEHYILTFQKDNHLPINPRQIKRIINLYTMKSQELSTTEVSADITQEMILKYVLFSTEYPAYNAEIKRLTFEEIEIPPEVIVFIKPLTIDIIKEYF